MSSEKHFLDEQWMTDLARKSIEVLRQEGASPSELRRLETLLKEGSVGEAFIMSSLLRTILSEISPEASQKKLLLVYRGLEEICQSLVELSRNLFDIEAWQHYRESRYESFESYCEEMLGIPSSKIHALRLLKDQPLPRPKNAGPAKLCEWLFDAVEILGGSQIGKAQ
jgi:hypothetical protein